MSATASWERITCPVCDRQIAISPKEQRMGLHAGKATQYCAGSYKTPDDARIDEIEFGALLNAVREDLAISPLFLARVEPLLVEIEKKYERDIEQEKQDR